MGGHCIGVDPYYLAQKAQEVGYHPEIILSGRRLNDGMGRYVANEIVKIMLKRGLPVLSSRILLLGITFKENCPDIRNTKAVDIYNELISFGAEVDVFDPWASNEEVEDVFDFALVDEPKEGYHAIILGVAHEEFRTANWQSRLTKDGILYDVKGILGADEYTARL